MTYLLDVNVLVALFWPNHNHNKPAQAWFEGVKRFATCPITELGFLRVSSIKDVPVGTPPSTSFIKKPQTRGGMNC